MTADDVAHSESAASELNLAAGRRKLTLTQASADGGPSAISAGAVVEAARDVVARSTPEEALQAVIRMAIDSAPCDAASITTLGRQRDVQTVASSDDRVLQADHLQYELGEGPCLDAVWINGDPADPVLDCP